MSWPFGLLFAVASAFATNVGFLLRQRGAVEAPDVDARHPVRTTIELFRRRWWAIGFAVAIVAWSLHVTALKFAPLSLVQAALASGFVLLAIIAERFFGFEVGRRQWAGILLTTAGVALLALTAVEVKTTGEHNHYKAIAAIGFEGGLLGIGAVLMVSRRARQAEEGRRGTLLAAGAGLLFTVSHIGIKALTGTLSVAKPASLLTPWVPIVVAAFVVAFLASARSLQIGEAVPVIAITSAVSNVAAILGGIVVFNDPLGSGPVLVALRIAAFGLVVLAAALIPAPTRLAAAQGDQRQERTNVRPALSRAA